MRTTLISVLLVAACGEGEPPDHDSDPPDTDAPPTETGDSGTQDTSDTEEPVVTIAASCEVSDDNVLRYVCQVAVDPPSPVEIAFEKAEGGVVRTFTSGEPLTDHELVLWLMAPETDYVWRAYPTAGSAEVSGTFTTGPVPSGADIVFDLDGSASFPYFAAASPCMDGAYVVIAGTGGEVLWYHGFGDEVFSFVDSASFTEDGTIIAIVNGDIIEVDLLGNELMRLERFVDYDEIVHHDVFRKDGHTWVLHKDDVVYNGENYTLDGFYVFDPAGALVADWRLFDHFQPVSPAYGFLGSDYSHANSLWVDAGGDVFVSMRHLSAVAHIEGDLTSPDFGTILWRMSGDPDDPDFGSDFTLTSVDPAISPTFEQQHNVHLLPDGTLTMFDNRENPFENSRLLHLSYDLALGEAAIEAAYELPLHCDFQGGAWHTAGGNPVATCGPIAKGFEFDLGVTDTPRWSADLDCAAGPGAYVPRFIPLEESDL